MIFHSQFYPCKIDTNLFKTYFYILSLSLTHNFLILSFSHTHTIPSYWSYHLLPTVGMFDIHSHTMEKSACRKFDNRARLLSKHSLHTNRFKCVCAAQWIYWSVFEMGWMRCDMSALFNQKSRIFIHHRFIIRYVKHIDKYKIFLFGSTLRKSNISKYCGGKKHPDFQQRCLYLHTMEMDSMHVYRYIQEVDFPNCICQKITRKWMLNGKPLQFITSHRRTVGDIE